MTISRYPLCWPAGWRRSTPGWRTRAKFGKRDRWSASGSYRMKRETTVADGVSRVLGELERMGILERDVVISTNVRTRLDGLPRSGDREPDDPGAAVYWREPTGDHRCIAIDRYDRVADNLAAIAATLDAMRAIERHGGAEILERAFTGFTALQHDTGGSWRTVLGIESGERDIEVVKAAYRRLRGEAHTDRGGDAEHFDAIQKAWKQAEQELKQ